MPRIVYLSWPANEIAGGIKLSYQHVETLRAANYDATIATPDGRPPEWFKTSAPTITLDELSERTDILVFPENHAGLLRSYKNWRCPKVVFCQNQFMAYRGLDGQACYSDFGVTDIIAEGRLVVEFCERRFPKLRIGSVPILVDTELFRVNTSKRLQIAYMPRKRPMEAEFIKDLFRAESPECCDIPWVAIAHKPEQDVARILADSAIYLSLCRFESYALSVLEALACGCVVAGFTGFGARIYTTAANGFWCEEDDALDCASQLARAVRLATTGGEAYSDIVTNGISDARRHNRTRFDERLLRYWSTFLARDQSASAI